MSKLSYKIMSTEYVDENGVLLEKAIPLTIELENPTESDIEYASKNAINGVYTIEDSDSPETLDNIINILLGVM